MYRRPNSLQDRIRDSDDDDFRDRDYDVSELANNLTRAFHYGIYVNDDIEEVRGPLERDDEDVYFDDESAEVVISSLRLGDDRDSGSLFTNSNWFAFEDNGVDKERISNSFTSSSPSTEDDKVVVGEDDLGDIATSSVNSEGDSSSLPMPESSDNGTLTAESGELGFKAPLEGDKPREWVEWRESSDLATSSGANNNPTVSRNGELELLCANGPNLVKEQDSVLSSSVGENLTVAALSDADDANNPSSGSLSDVEFVRKEDTTESMELDPKESMDAEVTAAIH